MQPLSARCMRVLLRFQMGAHSLPVVLGRRTGTPWDQRLCQRCDQHAVGDERHMFFECPAVQCVRESMLHYSRMVPAPCNSSMVLRIPSTIALTSWMRRCDQSKPII